MWLSVSTTVAVSVLLSSAPMRYSAVWPADGILSPSVVYRTRLGRRGTGAAGMSDFYDIAVPKIDGTPDLLGPLHGKVALAVNVASRCGLTPQYEGLEQLQRELAAENFTVIGFPCNQFAAQEPGSAAEIVEF